MLSLGRLKYANHHFISAPHSIVVKSKPRDGYVTWIKRGIIYYSRIVKFRGSLDTNQTCIYLYFTMRFRNRGTSQAAFYCRRGGDLKRVCVSITVRHYYGVIRPTDRVQDVFNLSPKGLRKPVNL